MTLNFECESGEKEHNGKILLCLKCNKRICEGCQLKHITQKTTEKHFHEDFLKEEDFYNKFIYIKVHSNLIFGDFDKKYDECSKFKENILNFSYSLKEIKNKTLVILKKTDELIIKVDNLIKNLLKNFKKLNIDKNLIDKTKNDLNEIKEEENKKNQTKSFSRDNISKYKNITHNLDIIHKTNQKFNFNVFSGINLNDSYNILEVNEQINKKKEDFYFIFEDILNGLSLFNKINLQNSIHNYNFEENKKSQIEEEEKNLSEEETSFISKKRKLI